MWDAAGDTPASARDGARGAGLSHAVLDPDGRRLAGIGSDADAGAESAALAMLAASAPAGLPLSPPAVWLAGTILVSRRPPCKVIDLATRAEVLLAQWPQTPACRSLWWSPDGKRLAGIHADKTVTVWDASTGAALAEHRDGDRGTLLYTGKGFTRFDPPGGLVEPTSPGRPASRIIWAPDGTRLAAVFSDDHNGYARVYDATAGDQPVIRASSENSLLLHVEEGYNLASLRWSPDGRRLGVAWNQWLTRAGIRR
jgi:WD40 repeat protein